VVRSFLSRAVDVDDDGPRYSRGVGGPLPRLANDDSAIPRLLVLNCRERQCEEEDDNGIDVEACKELS
jgi:hypothetical protein